MRKTKMKKFYLYSRDSKGKIRVLILTVDKDGDVYTISRESGLLNGKLTKQPDKVIAKGLVKRSSKEQAELEFASIVKKQKDKGYVLFQEIQAKKKEAIDPMNYSVIDSLLDLDKTDANGRRKPMSAKDTNVLKDADRENGTNKFENQLARAWWGSYKLDGIRTKAGIEDDSLVFLSKSGKEYQGVTTHFKNDPELIAFAKKYNCELDGEFYVHGMPLKDINGHCQKREYIPERHDQIKFYLFDMAIDGMDATERCKILNELEISNPRVVVVRHKYLVGMAECLAYEREAVDLEYEGVMIRTATGMYEFGKKSKEMWKLKPFQDAEFTIVGLSEGARDEDMCFIMQTGTGIQFKASIMANREEKLQYRADIESLMGCKGTVKFQYYTPDGKPFLPKFKCLRESDD